MTATTSRAPARTRVTAAGWRAPHVPPSWADHALCAQADPEAWFPEEGGSHATAKKICRRCPVRQPCLLYALAGEETFGIWGGLSTNERNRLRLERAS